MIIVPDIMQRLVQHYGVDALKLSAECEKAERVRTRTWLAGRGGTPRRELESLPSAFPPFKARIDEGVMRIERLRLGYGAIFESGKTYFRITMPWPNLPETLITALPGRPLAQLLGHAGIGNNVIIINTKMRDDDGEIKMIINVDMPHNLLKEVDTTSSQLPDDEGPNLDAIIHQSHDVIDAPAFSEEAMLDTRKWGDELGTTAHKVVGLSLIKPFKQDAPHVALRFPYSKDTAAIVGKSGVGAWFDRNSYAWHIEPTQRSLVWLAEFLETQDVIIGPDGRIHCRRNNR